MRIRARAISILMCLTILLGIATAAPASFSAADSGATEAEKSTESAPEIIFDAPATDPVIQPEEETVTEEPSQAQTETAQEQPDTDRKKIVIEEDTESKTQLPDDINKTVARAKASEGEGSNLAPDEPEFAEGEAIVLLDNEKAISEIKDDVDVASAITLEGSDSTLNLAVVEDENRTTEELIKDLSEEEGVESVIPNYISHTTAITNDPYSKYQWALNNTGQNNGTWGVDIDPETAWSKATARKKSCVVAVLDSGVSPSNNDLKPVLWKNTYRALPGYGYCGYDFTGTVKNHAPKDDTGHGSHVAGIIAAAGNNNSGISGINRSGVKIMALKVFHKGNSKFSDELKAFQYIIKAKKLGVNIKAVNCSYGGLGNLAARKEYDKIFNTLGSLGIVSCVSAGNEDSNIEYKSKGYYRLPSSSQSKYCLTVAATDEDGRITSYSNYSSKYVDIAAPGNDILSTVNYGRFLPSAYSASNLSKLCSYYQSYDTNAVGSIGYDIRDGYDTNGYRISSPSSFTITSSEYSGTSGKSLAVRLSNAYNRSYAFELPFYLDSLSGNYSISAMVKCKDASVSVGMYDIPSYYNYDDGPRVTYGMDETWTALNLNIKPNSTKYYRKATSRRLGFLITCKSNSATIYFDHIAVSKQNIDPAKFGKLDYYSGTSMATPYVTGAAALIANGFPELKAIDVIHAIKNSAIQSSKLTSFVYKGRLLNLKNIAKYAKVSYPLSTPKVTKLQNTNKGVRVTIGKVKGAVRYRVFYNNGKKWIKLGDTKTTTFMHKGVKSGKKYRYAVRCVSKDGKKLQSDFNHTGWVITYVAAPKPPTLKNTSKGVQITFKRVAGATKYRVFRKKGNGSWVKLVDTKSTSYLDKTAKKGVTYRYTIRCLSSKGKFISAYNNGSAIKRS